MAKKPPYGNSPGPKTPYAQDSPPLITNRAQRKQMSEIGMPMEPAANPRPTPKPPPTAPVATPPPRDINRQREVAERLRKRRETLDKIR